MVLNFDGIFLDTMIDNAAEGRNYYWSSDPHYSHKNICKYCPKTRGHFKSADEMNETLVANWNKKVEPGDFTILGGDICMGDIKKSTEYLYRLNGDIGLIIGNHDDQALEYQRFRDRFAWIKHYHEQWYRDPDTNKKQLIITSHWPFVTWHWRGKGSFMLHGHCHHNLPDDPKALRMDVGVDNPACGFAPFSLTEICRIMKKKTPENGPGEF